MSEIYLSITETPAVVTLSQPVAASQVAATVTVGNTVTVALDANSLSALEQVTVTVGAAVSVSNFPASQVVTGSVAVTTMPAISISSVTVSNFPGTQVVSVSNLPASQAVTVSNFPATQTIAGTVTANGGNFAFNESQDTSSGKGVLIGFEDDASTEFRRVTDVQPLPISISSINNTGGFNQALPISGTVTANVSGDVVYTDDPNGLIAVKSALYAQDSWLELQPIGNNNPLPISGTVTVGAMPNGTLTTRFGTPTTANTAFATSAVTNANRKYLLIQNVTTGSNVITVGIGFTPTTTQGIQLTAGAGITFESSYIPTGAVQILSSVTASNFTILEA